MEVNKKNCISSEFPGYIGGARSPYLILRDLRGSFISNREATQIDSRVAKLHKNSALRARLAGAFQRGATIRPTKSIDAVRKFGLSPESPFANSSLSSKHTLVLSSPKTPQPQSLFIKTVSGSRHVVHAQRSKEFTKWANISLEKDLQRKVAFYLNRHNHPPTAPLSQPPRPYTAYTQKSRSCSMPPPSELLYAPRTTLEMTRLTQQPTDEPTCPPDDIEDMDLPIARPPATLPPPEFAAALETKKGRYTPIMRMEADGDSDRLDSPELAEEHDMPPRKLSVNETDISINNSVIRDTSEIQPGTVPQEQDPPEYDEHAPTLKRQTGEEAFRDVERTTIRPSTSQAKRFTEPHMTPHLRPQTSMTGKKVATMKSLRSSTQRRGWAKNFSGVDRELYEFYASMSSANYTNSNFLNNTILAEKQFKARKSLTAPDNIERVIRNGASQRVEQRKYELSKMELKKKLDESQISTAVGGDTVKWTHNRSLASPTHLTDYLYNERAHTPVLNNLKTMKWDSLLHRNSPSPYLNTLSPGGRCISTDPAQSSILYASGVGGQPRVRTSKGRSSRGIVIDAHRPRTSMGR